MSMINKLQDDRLRNLAQTLRNSGLAASDSEAIRMAENMTRTESKVGNQFNSKEPQKKQETQRSETSFTPPPVRQEQPQFTSQVKQEEEDDFDEVPGSIEKLPQDIIKSSFEDISDLTVEEAAGLQDIPTLKEEPQVREEVKQEETKETSKVDEDDEYEVEETVEITQEKQPPKRDLSEFRESQVDLGSVFKFKK
jgi:hypothetical protein